MRFTVLRSKDDSCQICDKQNKPSISKLHAYNTSMRNSKFNVSDASTLFFPDLSRAQNMVRVIEGKIIWK